MFRQFFNAYAGQEYSAQPFLSTGQTLFFQITLRFELGWRRYNLGAMKHYWLSAEALVGLLTRVRRQS
jgi:hypothetical protein